MHKIKTIFDRDWDGNKKIIDKYVRDDLKEYLGQCYATEKLDGMNIRVTVRNHTIVRIEKRRNPSKIQKANKITEPWYVDTDPYDKSDKYILEAVKNTPFDNVDDGEHSAEAVGPKIQGNPLNLDEHKIFILNPQYLPWFTDAPVTFEELKEWLPKQKSKVGNDCPIEGIVWHRGFHHFYKIKTKDFK